MLVTLLIAHFMVGHMTCANATDGHELAVTAKTRPPTHNGQQNATTLNEVNSSTATVAQSATATNSSMSKDKRSNTTDTNTINSVTSVTIKTRTQYTKISLIPPNISAPTMDMITASTATTPSATKARNSSTPNDKRTISTTTNSVTSSTNIDVTNVDSDTTEFRFSSTEETKYEEMVNETTTMPDTTVMQCPEILDLKIDHKSRREGEKSDIIWRASDVSDKWMEKKMEISIYLDTHIELVIQVNITYHWYPMKLPFDKKTKVCLTIGWNNWNNCTNCTSCQKCVLTTKASLPLATHGMSNSGIVALTLLIILAILIALFVYKCMRRLKNNEVDGHVEPSDDKTLPTNLNNRRMEMAAFEKPLHNHRSSTDLDGYLIPKNQYDEAEEHVYEEIP